MIVWKMTLAQFLAGLLETEHDDDPDFFEEQLRAIQWQERTIIPFTHNPRYATAAPVGGKDLQDQVLLEYRDDAWAAVGFYLGPTIYLTPIARKKELAEKLILRCAVNRDAPAKRDALKKGLSALKRAHELAVRKAVAVGLPVPEQVRQDYRL
jgi:hypothetical protein